MDSIFLMSAGTSNVYFNKLNNNIEIITDGHDKIETINLINLLLDKLLSELNDAKTKLADITQC